MSELARRARRRIAEPGDLVIYFSTEWTVLAVEDGVAELSRHNDRSNTVKVDVAAIEPPLVKAADR